MSYFIAKLVSLSFGCLQSKKPQVINYHLLGLSMNWALHKWFVTQFLAHTQQILI